MARLLVSVQNKHEAVMAHEAGVVMIDAKDAVRGSFAPCDLTTLQDIARACPHATLSAALGPCFSMMKLILVGSWNLNWRSKETFAFGKIAYDDSFTQRMTSAVSSSSSLRRIALVCVDCVSSSRDGEFVTHAHRHGFAGVMMDTWHKNHGDLLRHRSLEQLHHFIAAAHGLGLLCGLAGGLSLPQLVFLARHTAVDYVGTRGGVCEGTREGIIDATRVASLNKQINDTAGADPLMAAPSPQDALTSS